MPVRPGRRRHNRFLPESGRGRAGGVNRGQPPEVSIPATASSSPVPVSLGEEQELVLLSVSVDEESLSEQELPESVLSDSVSFPAESLLSEQEPDSLLLPALSLQDPPEASAVSSSSEHDPPLSAGSG